MSYSGLDRGRLRTELEARAEGHTPFPWSAGFGHLVRVRQKARDGVVIAGFHRIGAGADQIGPEPRRVAEANAAICALAGNSYYAMREALEMIRDADEDCKLDGLPTIPEMARAKIDAALRLARGEISRPENSELGTPPSKEGHQAPSPPAPLQPSGLDTREAGVTARRDGNK